MSWRSFAVVAALLVIVAPAMAGGDDQSIQDLRAEIAALQAKVESLEIGAMADRTATLERAVADLAADVEENSFSSNVSAPFLRAIDLSGGVRMLAHWEDGDTDVDTRLTIGAHAVVSDSVSVSIESLVDADFGDDASAHFDDEITQMYVDLANMAGTGWSARIGRQELSIGSELVYGNDTFSNDAGSYDVGHNAIVLNGNFGGRASGSVFMVNEEAAAGDDDPDFSTGIYASLGAIEGYDVNAYYIDVSDKVWGIEAAGDLGGMSFNGEYADQDSGGTFWEINFDVNMGDYAGGLADEVSIGNLSVTIDEADGWTEYTDADYTDRYMYGTFVHSAAQSEHWSVATSIAGFGVEWHDFDGTDGLQVSYATDAIGMPATFYYQELDDEDLVFMEASFSF